MQGRNRFCIHDRTGIDSLKRIFQRKWQDLNILIFIAVSALGGEIAGGKSMNVFGAETGCGEEPAQGLPNGRGKAGFLG